MLLAHSPPVAGAGSQNSVGCETARAQPRWVILALSKPSCGGGPGPAGCWARRIDMHVGGSHICMSLFCPQAFMWAERSKHPFSSFRGPALRVVRGDRCIMYHGILIFERLAEPTRAKKRGRQQPAGPGPPPTWRLGEGAQDLAWPCARRPATGHCTEPPGPATGQVAIGA